MKDMNELYDDTRNRIFNVMQSQHMDQRTLAQKLEISPQTITDWKNGKSKSFAKCITQIAEALDISPEYLLTGEGPRTKMPITETEKSSKAATPEGSGNADEFARIFAQLTPENQNKIIAEMLKRQRNQ